MGTSNVLMLLRTQGKKEKRIGTLYTLKKTRNTSLMYATQLKKIYLEDPLTKIFTKSCPLPINYGKD